MYIQKQLKRHNLLPLGSSLKLGEMWSAHKHPIIYLGPPDIGRTAGRGTLSKQEAK